LRADKIVGGDTDGPASREAMLTIWSVV